MIHDLKKQGLSNTAIARQLGISRRTVTRRLQQGLEAPAYGPRPQKPRLVEAFEAYLRDRVTAWPDLSAIRGAASAPSELRALASRVRRVGLAGRFDPEAAFIERDELAHALCRLADRLEHRLGQQPAAPASTSRAVLPERFAAVLAAKASEIERLRALLAQAVLPRRRRRRAASEAQLMLPLSETANDR